MPSAARRGSASLLVVLTAILLLSTACGDDEKKRAALFDVVGARRGIQTELARSYTDLVVEKVHCPKRVVRKVGRSFECTASVSAADVPIDVEIGRGHEYTFQTVGNLVTKAVAEQAVAARVTLAPTAVDCGPDPVRVLPVGGTINCSVTFADGNKATAVVRVADQAGHLTVDTQ